MSEILAPAGDESCFFAAIEAGADAVYLGLSDFSARKSAANFSLGNLKKYIDYAHVLKTKVYVAMNTLVKDGELEDFTSCLLSAYRLGADAVIMQDIFLGKHVKELYPDICLHLSTQAGCCNASGARMAKRYGFSRVILARETPLKDIEKIARIVETEVFVQGALCTCFSGQCYLSAFAGGNSGNRGYCKQPCRKKYKIDRKGFEKDSYALSLADLCAGENIVKLIEAGAVSFKIEGRMRSPEYVRSAVRYYKDLLAGNCTRAKENFSAMKRAFNRGGYTAGYLFGQDKNLISRDMQGHAGERIGMLEKSGETLFVNSSFRPSVGDGFKVIRNGNAEIGGFAYTEIKAPSEKGFFIPLRQGFREGDAVHVTSASSRRGAEREPARLRRIELRLRAYAGEKLSAQASGDFGEFSLESDFYAEAAQNSALDVFALKECFAKTDVYPFDVRFACTDIGKNVFVVKSRLNAFRRGFYEKLFARLSFVPRIPYVFTPLFPEPIKGDGKRAKAIIDDARANGAYENTRVEYFIFKPENYKNRRNIQSILQKSEYYASHKYLYIPAYALEDDIENIRKIALLFDGLYCDGYFGIELGKELDLPVFAGTGMNAFNRVDVAVLQGEGVKALALSKELSARESEKLSGCEGVYLFSGGNIKVMDLGHCPFSKSCGECDKRERYLMTDEAGRKFPLRRFENGECRFELYNCAPLLCGRKGGAALYDFTLLECDKRRAYLDRETSEASLKKTLVNYTAGLTKTGIR